MKLGHLNIFNNARKNYATHGAAMNTLKQAKKECRDWSKLTMAVADLASELKQEIVKSMDLPSQRDPSNGNPFVELSHNHVNDLDQMSSDYKNVSDSFRSHKRQAAKGVFSGRAKVATDAVVMGYVVGAAVPTFGGSLGALHIVASGPKSTKEGSLNSGLELSQAVASTLEVEEVKALDDHVSQIKDIAAFYSPSVVSGKINTLLNEIQTLKTKLDSAEHSPFVHKMKAATQARAELHESLVGKDRDEVFSTLDSALSDLKQSESYKPVRSKKFKTDKTEVRAADIDHFFAKIEKKAIKANVRFEKTAMHNNSVGLGSPLRSSSTPWLV